MSTPEDKLRELLGPVTYSDLQAHLDRGAVFLVSPDLDLLPPMTRRRCAYG